MAYDRKQATELGEGLKAKLKGGTDDGRNKKGRMGLRETTWI